jgi:hypothetical protein
MVMNCCIKKLIFLFVRCLLHMLPAAPTAALAALERPSVATIGPSVAAARAAPLRSPPPCGKGFGGRLQAHGGTAAADRIARAGGGGQGRGGVSDDCPFAATFFLAGAGTGTTDSSLVHLAAGSPSSPPLARSAMSFLVATLLALEVR